MNKQQKRGEHVEPKIVITGGNMWFMEYGNFESGLGKYWKY